MCVSVSARVPLGPEGTMDYLTPLPGGSPPRPSRASPKHGGLGTISPDALLAYRSYRRLD